jgi:demethylmenaquinone methyltransferase/2-methoxy-6-polyprenyl-1,4-benzoquinol methylase
MKNADGSLPQTDSERIGLVKKIFSSITPTYDFLNHLLSMKRDVAWRRASVKRMCFFETRRFLDVATGTADLAIEAALRHTEIHVTGVDFVPEMIRLGEKKVARKGLGERTILMEGDANGLPFADGSFDVAAIAFGIRNIPDKTRALSEMRRVVVPGGQVMVLELTSPRGGFMKAIHNIYLNRALPMIGRVFSGDPEAYRYLAESIMDFPTPDEFLKIMRVSGLVETYKISLTLGAAHLYVGHKPFDTNRIVR